MRPVITILSDFGPLSTAVCRGVMIGICPYAFAGEAKKPRLREAAKAPATWPAREDGMRIVVLTTLSRRGARRTRLDIKGTGNSTPSTSSTARTPRRFAPAEEPIQALHQRRLSEGIHLRQKRLSPPREVLPAPLRGVPD
jgi:hypothetical protein